MFFCDQLVWCLQKIDGRILQIKLNCIFIVVVEQSSIVVNINKVLGICDVVSDTVKSFFLF